VLKARPSTATSEPSHGPGDGRHPGGALRDRAQGGEQGAEAEDYRGDPGVVLRRGGRQQRPAENEPERAWWDLGPPAEPNELPAAGVLLHAHYQAGRTKEPASDLDVPG